MRIANWLFVLVVCGVLSGPAAYAAEGQKRPLRIGFVYISPVGDAGWSYAHDIARQKLGMDPANITYLAEGIAEGEDAEHVITNMSEQGYDVIVTTSYNYMDTTLKVAANFPNTVYLHCSGHKTSENVSAFFGRMYQARYLSGMVAGSMSKSNIIGFVGAHSIPEVIRGVNSFTLGVRQTNPDAVVKVIWTNTWYDPFLERDATLALIKSGADVIAQDQDSATPQVVAEKEGVYSVGYNTDMSNHAPKAHLVAAVWDWSVFYYDVVEKIRKGTWKSGSFWLGMDTGIVDLSPFGPMVPDAVRNAAMARRQEIKDGSFKVFQGPVRDNTGTLRIPEGTVPSDKELQELDWLVEGISVLSE